MSRVIREEQLLLLNSRSNHSTEPLQGSSKDVPSLTEDKAISDPREMTKLDPDLTQEIHFRAGISLALAALNGWLPKAQFIPIKSLGFSEGKSYLSSPFLSRGTTPCSPSSLGC